MIDFSFELIAAVFICGGLGALGRYAILALCAGRMGALPGGVIAVNAAASLLGGILLMLQLPLTAAAALSGGVVGSLGTLSSLCSDLIDLYQRRHWALIIIYALLTVGLGIGMTILGFNLGLKLM